MNPLENLIDGFRDLAGHVPELLQPIIIALAGAVPFIEGEVSAMIGVWAGLHPIVAGLAGAVGNFVCVMIVVFAGARIRAAVLARRQRRAVAVGARSGAAPAVQPSPVDLYDATTEPTTEQAAAPDAEPESKGARKFRRFLVRFGVPGASILGPLALPTQFTSAILVASGVSKGWVLLWQAVAIVLWTGLTTLSAWGALALFVY